MNDDWKHDEMAECYGPASDANPPRMTDEMVTKGWAVFDNGQIIVATVSSERRAAIINWLVTERCMMVLNSDTDEKIEQAWQSMKITAECCEVKISAALAAIGGK